MEAALPNCGVYAATSVPLEQWMLLILSDFPRPATLESYGNQLEMHNLILPPTHSIRIFILGLVCWYTSVISASQEAEVGGLWLKARQR
jgi:hypothetical protein